MFSRVDFLVHFFVSVRNFNGKLIYFNVLVYTIFYDFTSHFPYNIHFILFLWVVFFFVFFFFEFIRSPKQSPIIFTHNKFPIFLRSYTIRSVIYHRTENKNINKYIYVYRVKFNVHEFNKGENIFNEAKIDFSSFSFSFGIFHTYHHQCVIYLFIFFIYTFI